MEKAVTGFERFPGKPGRYNLKIASWLPTVSVSVFKNSLHQENDWRLRCAGIVVNPGKILSKDLWEGPLVTR